MATKAQREAVRRYDDAHTRQIKLKLNITTDADVIERLRAVDNVQGYIKGLIRKDIKAGE